MSQDPEPQPQPQQTMNYDNAVNAAADVSKTVVHSIVPAREGWLLAVTAIIAMIGLALGVAFWVAEDSAVARQARSADYMASVEENRKQAMEAVTTTFKETLADINQIHSDSSREYQNTISELVKLCAGFRTRGLIEDRAMPLPQSLIDLQEFAAESLIQNQALPHERE